MTTYPALVSMSCIQLPLFCQWTHCADGIGRHDPETHKVCCQDLSKLLGFAICVLRFVQVRMESDEPVRIAEALEIVLPLVVMRYPAESGTAEKCAKTIRQALNYFLHNGAELIEHITPEMVDDFLWLGTHRREYKEPSSATAANRQWALRVLFDLLREMGVWDRPDITGDTIEREHGRSSRPAAPDEIEQIQIMATNVLVPSGDELLLALALCGGGASEIAVVCREDIDLDEGEIHFVGVNERVNRIPEWSQHVFEENLTRLPEGTPLVVRPGLPLARATQSVTTRLNNLMKRAGLSRVSELTGVSIRLGATQQVLATDGLEAAARFLGNQSLDLTAKSLRYDWWAQG